MQLVISLNTRDMIYEQMLLKDEGVKYKACRVSTSSDSPLRPHWMIECDKIDVFNDIYKLCLCYDVNSIIKLDDDKCYLVEFKDNGFYTEMELLSYFIEELS